MSRARTIIQNIRNACLKRIRESWLSICPELTTRECINASIHHILKKIKINRKDLNVVIAENVDLGTLWASYKSLNSSNKSRSVTYSIQIIHTRPASTVICNVKIVDQTDVYYIEKTYLNNQYGNCDKL